MKAQWILLLAMLIPEVLAGQTRALGSTQTMSDLNAISPGEVATMQRLAEAINPALLGFRDPRELDQAVVGVPIREYIIPLDRLKEFEPSTTNPESLLNSTNRVTMPVLVNQSARSAITLEMVEGKWTAVSYGGSNFVSELTTLRSELALRDDNPESEYFEVKVPALNVVLLGSQRNGDIFLTSLLDDDRFGLRRGESLPAAALLERLLPAARAHNGLPT
jgi:hypothetical protein